MKTLQDILQAATEDVMVRCSDTQISRLIDVLCKEIADSDQEYHNANTQDGWRLVFETEESMTKEQVMETYGDVPLTFVYYYKYTFAFAGEAPDGDMVTMMYGGDRDDIYKYEVKVSKPVTLREYADDYYGASVSKNGAEIWKHHP